MINSSSSKPVDSKYSNPNDVESSALLGGIYRNIVELSECFIVNWNAKDGKILYCNAAFAKRWGGTVGELLGNSIVELRSEADQKTFQDSLDQMEPNKQYCETYSHIIDGKRQHANVSISSLSRDGKQTDEFYVVGFDCTDEHSYRISLDSLFAVFSDDSLDIKVKIEQLLSVGLDYFDLETAIVSKVGPKECEVLYLNSYVDTQLTCGMKKSAHNTIDSLLASTNTVTVIDDISSSSFASTDCHAEQGVKCLIGSAVTTGTGPFGAISFTSREVRNRPFTKLESNLAVLIANCINFLIANEEQHSLMENINDYYKSLFRRIPAMLFLTDADGLIISASHQLCSQLGMESKQVAGKICFDLFDTDDKQTLINAVTLDDVRKMPLSIHSKDGHTVEVEINSSVKATNNLNGIRMVVMNDVSERNKVARQIEEKNRTLEAANNSLNQFTAIASHDLQEPLRKIQRFGSLLKEEIGGALTQDGEFMIDTMLTASERMNTLIKDLLAYATTSQENNCKEIVCLNNLLDEVKHLLDISIMDSNAKIHIGKLPDILGDKSLLRQMFINLIGNSIKYRSEDRPVEVSVMSFVDGNQLGLTIRDNGIGFEMEHAENIFKPFNRLHSHNEYKGTGIGLAICESVCEKHNWSIRAESQLNVGSTFKIFFNAV